ncbi:class I SAM-dependent methyltransferase [Stella sp.]|uniref:class I SAM-dependent methyltransferase n=1 Tax=Stella sp. TaxID=2912054 RepID=UPI0035B1E4E9
MTLARRIADRIRAGGPITVAAFMEAAMQDPEDGYYRRGDPLGRSGDFVTAPEVSQMFGELIGLWCVEGWLAAGSPSPIRLVELGPGRGTLMADALRATARVPGFHAALRLHLVESSPGLRRRQAALLAAAGPQWHERLEDVPADPLWLVANEFLDALPVHQLVRTADGWAERAVTLAPDGGFAFADILPAPPDLVPDRDLPPGTVVERRPAAEALAAAIARRIAAAGGRALLVDYGYDAGAGDTLQAVGRHGRVPVLEAPGTVDLSAHVAFADIAAAVRAAGAAAWGPVPQGRFLRSLGIAERAERLAAARPDARATLAAALHRLIGAGAMGTLFKVLAITPEGAPPPAGFAAAAPGAAP